MITGIWLCRTPADTQIQPDRQKSLISDTAMAAIFIIIAILGCTNILPTAVGIVFTVLSFIQMVLLIVVALKTRPQVIERQTVENNQTTPLTPVNTNPERPSVENETPPSLPPLPPVIIEAERWNRMLNESDYRSANLIDGTQTDALVPEGDHSNLYSQVPGLRDDNIQEDVRWRLPPSRLTAFPTEIREFCQHALENNQLEIFFVGASYTSHFPNVVPNVRLEMHFCPLASNGESERVAENEFEFFSWECRNIHTSEQGVTFTDLGQQNAWGYVAVRYRQRICLMYLFINMRNHQDYGSIWGDACASTTRSIPEFLNAINTADTRYSNRADPCFLVINILLS